MQLNKQKELIKVSYMETKRPDIMTDYKRIHDKVRWETRKAARVECDNVATAHKDNPKNFGTMLTVGQNVQVI